MSSTLPGLDNLIAEVGFAIKLDKFDSALGEMEETLEALKRRGGFALAIAQMANAIEAEQERVAAETSYTAPDGQLLAVRWRTDGPEETEITFMYMRPGDSQWRLVSPGTLGIGDGEWFAGHNAGISLSGSPFIETTTPNGTKVQMCLDDGETAVAILETAKLIPTEAAPNGYDYRESA